MIGWFLRFRFSKLEFLNGNIAQSAIPTASLRSGKIPPCICPGNNTK